LFGAAGEQESVNVLGRTQVGDLCFSDGDQLMVESETRDHGLRNPIGLPTGDGENTGDAPVFTANLFGDDFVTACAYFGVQCSDVCFQNHSVLVCNDLHVFRPAMRNRAFAQDATRCRL